MIKARRQLENVHSYEIPSFTRKDKIRLDLNESLFGCSPKVIEALREINTTDLDIYPEYDLLSKKIANNLSVKKENVLLTNGADDAIRIIIDTFIDRRDEILIPVPTYSMFELYSDLCGAWIKRIQYKEGFSFPINDILQNIGTWTKIVVIVNPASPLGTLIPEDYLIKILKKAKDSIVLLDETYWHFAGESHSGLLKKYKNLVIVQTFSKIFGLAGMRLGFILANESLMPEINKVAFPYAVTYPAVVAGYAALNDKGFIKEIVKKINIEKEFLCLNLRKSASRVHQTKTNFILADFGLKSDFVHKSLFKKGILVKNIGSMPLMDGFLRITVGTRKENKILIDAINDILE
jgi:histidinol-phosphate aminotransferase